MSNEPLLQVDLPGINKLKSGKVREIFAHIDQLQKKAGRTLADWVKRFNDKVKPAKPAK